MSVTVSRLTVLLCALAGCSSSASVPTNPLIVARPYNSNIPRGYHGQSTPLLILLHGYSANGVIQDAYFGITNLSEAKTFLYAYPDGTVDSGGKHFWNATDACCDFGHTNVDDVAYINAIIDDFEHHYNVDKKRIFVIGHSNGGFMSHRMACDSAGRIAGIMSLAGAVWKDASKCQPSAGVSILDVHGDMDTEVPFDGGGATPGEKDTLATWAAKNGCTGSLTATSETMDLDSTQPGAETTVSRYDGCARGAVELWTIRGAPHLPNLIQPDWGNAVWAWLMAHPKP